MQLFNAYLLSIPCRILFPLLALIFALSFFGGHAWKIANRPQFDFLLDVVDQDIWEVFLEIVIADKGGRCSLFGDCLEKQRDSKLVHLDVGRLGFEFFKDAGVVRTA